MGNIAEFTVWGLGGAIVVSLLMEALKRILVDADGNPIIKDRWAVLAAIGIGIILSALAAFGDAVPAAQTVLDIIGAGLLAGLSATGIFSLAKKRE